MSVFEFFLTEFFSQIEILVQAQQNGQDKDESIKFQLIIVNVAIDDPREIKYR